MIGHTQGRLTVRGGFSIYAEDGKTPVADTCLNDSVAAHDEANARRLVACWNAFAIGDNIPTDAIEEVDGSETIIGKYVQACRERDALLDELRNIATADPRTWDADVRDQFQAWAQNRARFIVGRVESCEPIYSLSDQRDALARLSEGTESARRIIGEAPRIITEADRIAADMSINELKNTGELRRRDDERALSEQVKHEVPR